MDKVKNDVANGSTHAVLQMLPWPKHPVLHAMLHTFPCHGWLWEWFMQGASGLHGKLRCQSALPLRRDFTSLLTLRVFFHEVLTQTDCEVSSFYKLTLQGGFAVLRPAMIRMQKLTEDNSLAETVISNIQFYRLQYQAQIGNLS